MYRNQKISLYFPCRNESNHLEKIFSRIPDFVDEVIVVSNQSTDDTFEKARKLGVKAYKDDRVMGGIGYGYANITGIDRATGDIIISSDGDGTYPIESLAEILDFFIEKGFDFISCNRYPLKKGVFIPFKLRFGIYILNIETFLLYGLKINDILSGMWLLKKGVKSVLNLTAGDWNLSPQIKINAFTNRNIKSGEYRIVQHLRYGKTKQNYFKTGLSHMKWIFLNRFHMY